MHHRHVKGSGPRTPPRRDKNVRRPQRVIGQGNFQGASQPCIRHQRGHKARRALRREYVPTEAQDSACSPSTSISEWQPGHAPEGETGSPSLHRNSSCHSCESTKSPDLGSDVRHLPASAQQNSCNRPQSLSGAMLLQVSARRTTLPERRT